MSNWANLLLTALFYSAAIYSAMICAISSRP